MPHPAVSETDVLASVCRESFEDFVREFWHVLVPERLTWNWHLTEICAQTQTMMERVFAGVPKAYDLVCNISPGTSKSTLFSIMLPAWCWTRMPSFRFIGASYAYPLAMDLSRKTRDVVQSDLYRATFPHVKIREDQNTKGYFQNTAGGFRYAVGVNGSVTGFHGHTIVVDDPLDPNQAFSPADLAAANYWIKETLPSRKVDKRVTPTLLVMQRLCQGDPTDLFLSRKARHLCIPAELTESVSPAGLREKYADGLMDPVRLPHSVLDDARSDMGEAGFEAQYNQRPVPPGGGLFKVDRIQIMRVPAGLKFDDLVRFWDKAGSVGSGAYTVGLLMGKDTDGRFWVLDVFRDRLGAVDRERAILRTAIQDGTKVRVGLEQEGGSGGKESAEASVRMLAGYKVFVVRSDRSTGGKEERATPAAAQVGNIVLKEADWNAALLEELKSFPKGTYKDQGDALSGAFNALAKRRRRAGAVG